MWGYGSGMDELRALVELIERLHVRPGLSPWQWSEAEIAASEITDCVGFSEGLECCLDRVRSSPEFQAAKARTRSDRAST